MSDNILFEVGQPVGIFKLTSLPLLKLSQIEQTMLFDEKRFIVGRLLGTEESCTLKVDYQTSFLMVTISGFVISVKEKDINLEPSSKMDAFLKEQEYLYLSQGLQPYDGKLIKKEDENWYIKI